MIETINGHTGGICEGHSIQQITDINIIKAQKKQKLKKNG